MQLLTFVLATGKRQAVHLTSEHIIVRYFFFGNYAIVNVCVSDRKEASDASYK